MASTQHTSKSRNRHVNNHVETGGGFVGLPKQLSNEVKQNVSAAKDEFFDQLLGIKVQGESDQMTQNREVKPYEKFTLYDSDRKAESAAKGIAKSEKKPSIDAAIAYHAEMARKSEHSLRAENREMQEQIQEITQELQRLISSSDKIIQMEYASYQVSSAPKSVGKYHTNFLSWMLTVVRDARRKVEDAGAWMSVAKSKGKSRGYTMSSKKLGTSFTQANERNVATQTG